MNALKETSKREKLKNWTFREETGTSNDVTLALRYLFDQTDYLKRQIILSTPRNYLREFKSH